MCASTTSTCSRRSRARIANPPAPRARLAYLRATRRTSAPAARRAATLAATNGPKPGCRALGYRLETTRIRTRSGRPHVVILDENLPVPLDRRVWQEALALV